MITKIISYINGWIPEVRTLRYKVFILEREVQRKEQHKKSLLDELKKVGEWLEKERANQRIEREVQNKLHDSELQKRDSVERELRELVADLASELLYYRQGGALPTDEEIEADTQKPLATSWRCRCVAVHPYYEVACKECMATRPSPTT